MSVDILNSVPLMDSARLIAQPSTVGSVMKNKTFAFGWFGRVPAGRMTGITLAACPEETRGT